MSKYHNKKTEIDGILFDSKREAEYYQELKLMQHSVDGVKSFTLQPEFILQEEYEKDGKKYRPIIYRADFDVTYYDGRREIVDVKGMRTKDWKLKAKMFDYKYPNLTLVIV